MKSNQKELNEQFLSLGDRKLWWESDLKESNQRIDNGCVHILLEW